MTKIQFGVITGLLLLLTCVDLLPIVAPGRTSPEFEYRIEAIRDENFDSKMARMGEAGWEVVSARRALGGEGGDRQGLYEIIFKRPK